MAEGEPALQRRRRLTAAAAELARDHDGVLSRTQLRRIGVTRWDIRREARGRRWTVHGEQAVALHTGKLDQRAQWRVALLEIGRHAALDGVTALLAAGLRNYQEQVIHVSVPRGSRPGSRAGVRVHETRRRSDTDVLAAGLQRVRPAIAAVRAALWATTDRQAALLIVMAVQQRLTTGAAIADTLRSVRLDRRRVLLNVIIRDVTDGAQALGELDFAALCRERGHPEPSRQVLRKGPRGRHYLDVYWEDFGLVAEIEGIHHGAGETQVDDALRQNALSLGVDVWLRLPLLGLRIATDAFMEQVAAALQRAAAAA